MSPETLSPKPRSSDFLLERQQGGRVGGGVGGGGGGGGRWGGGGGGQAAAPKKSVLICPCYTNLQPTSRMYRRLAGFRG